MRWQENVRHTQYRMMMKTKKVSLICRDKKTVTCKIELQSFYNRKLHFLLYKKPQQALLLYDGICYTNTV